ncbi:GGDEF domain-containing protein [Oceanispirochaeta crateris]|nr:diguanylate cyclase [Oceanispirochaeta crateris]
MITFLIAFLPSLVFGSGIKENRVFAETGVIDLSSINFNNHPPVGLDGMWEFRWNELLEPEDARWGMHREESQFYPVPLFWTSYGDHQYDSIGQGTYRLIVRTSGQTDYYGISLPEIFSEYKFWINDDLIDQRWDAEGTHVKFLKPSVFVIYSDSDTLELILQVRNRSHSNAGIGQSILFGSEQSVFRSQIFSLSLDLILIAICLFAGIYHSIIYIFRKEEKELLFFGIFCFILSLRTFSTGTTLLTQALPDLSFLVGSRIATAVIPLAVISFQIFAYYFFKKYTARKAFLILLAFNSAYLVMVFVVDSFAYSSAYAYYLLIILATCGFIIGIDIYAIIKREKFALLFLLGFVLLFVGIANDMMHYLQIIITGYYLSAFFAGFILLESLILSIKFSQDHMMISVLSERLESAVNKSNLDPLTGIYNRRFLILSGQRELEMSRRNGQSFSLVMMDVDYFKEINDTYGHDIGDHVIIELTRVISSSIRGSDILTRFGGDEFVLLLPQTGINEAFLVAEKLRGMVEKSAIPINKDADIKITLSLGVSCTSDEVQSFDELMRLADQMLYKSKEKGRNSVC